MSESPKEGVRKGRLEIVEMGPHHVLATFRNVGMALWIDDTPVEAVHRAQAMLATLALLNPSSGIGFLQVVCDGCQQLPHDSRHAIQALLKAGRTYIREAPVVFEGTGFRAATVRAIVSSIAAMSNHGFPHRVFPTVAVATQALARGIELREPTTLARELAEAVATARMQHRMKFPRVESMQPPRTSWRPKMQNFFRNS